MQTLEHKAIRNKREGCDTLVFIACTNPVTFQSQNFKGAPVGECETRAQRTKGRPREQNPREAAFQGNLALVHPRKEGCLHYILERTEIHYPIHLQKCSATLCAPSWERQRHRQNTEAGRYDGRGTGTGSLTQERLTCSTAGNPFITLTPLD